MKIQHSKGVNVAKTSSKTSSQDNNILDTALQWGENLGEHPVNRGLAVLGVGLGVLGEFGSGAVEYFSAGFATPVAVPLAVFSTNSIVTSTSDLIYIGSGHSEKQGNINILKWISEGTEEIMGKGIDEVAHLQIGRAHV